MIKPTVEEISDYMLERGFNEEDQPEAFYDYFESNGWHVGKTKMKNWQAAVRNWIRNAKKWSKRNDPRPPQHQSNHQSFADRQRQQANQAMQELEAMEFRNRETGLRLVR